MSSDAWVRESERPFLRLAEDWAERVSAQGSWVLTDFLTPREEYLAKSVAARMGHVVETSGGHEYAERKRMLVMPDQWYPTPSDFEIDCLKLEALDGEIHHKDVLGSVLGLGVQRKTIGDISIVRRFAYVFVARQMTHFVYDELHRVGRTTVSVTKEDEAPKLPPPAYEDRDITVASLRLDAVIAGACHLSRSQAQTAVERGHVTLNFREAVSRDEVDEGDILSLRGFGRVKVVEAMGATRRDRIRLRVGILRSNA
jgi:RNA-binding protein YlmH